MLYLSNQTILYFTKLGFNIVAKDPEHPTVSDQMHPTSVREHRCEEGWPTEAACRAWTLLCAHVEASGQLRWNYSKIADRAVVCLL